MLMFFVVVVVSGDVCFDVVAIVVYFDIDVDEVDVDFDNHVNVDDD